MVTGRKASGIQLASGIDDWLPPEAAAVPVHERPGDTSPSDWLPADLPERRSAPPPPERKRSTVNQVPPELLAAAAVETPPAPEPAEPAPPPPAAADADADAVNVNSAGVDELMTLPGITRRAATEIVEHREAHGPFASVEALVDVPGFHAGRVERLAGRATV